MNHVSGAYTATYNAKRVGQTETGYRLSHELFKQIITGDETGQTPIDAIHQGQAQFVTFTAQEANAEAIDDLIAPYSGIPGVMGPIGKLDVGNDVCPGAAKELVLTTIPGLCPGSRGPETITFPKAILAEGYPVDVLHGPNLRMIPLRLRVYPTQDPNTGLWTFYTTTMTTT